MLEICLSVCAAWEYSMDFSEICYILEFHGDLAVLCSYQFDTLHDIQIIILSDSTWNERGQHRQHGDLITVFTFLKNRKENQKKIVKFF